MGMAGIIIELQKEALDKDTRISDLLRKALAVARKLKISDIEAWVLSELNGYESGSEIPEYRQVSGQIKAFNNYNGAWVPIMFAEEDADTHRRLTRRACGQAVSELEALIHDNPEQVGMQYSPEVQARLMKAADMPFPPMLLVSVSSLHGILDCVRTTILEWALKLEEEGVIGEDLSFSDKEKEAAASVTINVETMAYSQIQAGTVNSSQSMENEINIEQLIDYIDQLERGVTELALDEDKLSELTSEVSTIKAQVSSPKPKQGIIRESLASIRSILEGASGNMTAHGLLEALSNIF